MMKHIFFLTVLTFFCAVGNLKAQEEAKTAFTLYDSPKPGVSVPYYDKDGSSVYLSAFKGKVVVLNFWKPTCRLCLIELPALNRLKALYADKPFVVIAVSEGEEGPDVIATVLRDRRLKQIDVAYDKDMRLLKALGGQKVPRTLLLNQDGQEVGYIQGLADFNAPDLQKQIDALF